MKYYILFLLFSSLGALAGTMKDELTSGLPEDVTKMIDRRIGCNHWAGEMPKVLEAMDHADAN